MADTPPMLDKMNVKRVHLIVSQKRLQLAMRGIRPDFRPNKSQPLGNPVYVRIYGQHRTPQIEHENTRRCFRPDSGERA